MCPRFWPAAPHGVETARCPAATHGWTGPTVGAGCASTCSWSAPAPPASPRRSPRTSGGCARLVVDKATFPRDKTCGDGLTHRRCASSSSSASTCATSRMPPSSARRCSSRRAAARSRCRSRPTAHYAGGRAPARARRRARRRHARSRGVDVCRGRGAHRPRVTTTDGVRARVGDGSTVEARHVIAADGHCSTVRRLLEPDAPADLGTWHAFRQYFRGVDDTRLWVLFEADLLPGYAWVVPAPGGRANVGFGMLRDARHRGAGSSRHGGRDLLARPSLRRILGPRRRSQRTRIARGRSRTTLRAGTARRRPRPLRGRRGGRRRPDDRRRHRAGARERACSRRRPSPRVVRRIGSRRATSTGSVACSGATCASPRRCNGVLRSPLGARGAIRARGPDAVDAAQLRPLDVRGLSACAPAHARPLASSHAVRSRRVLPLISRRGTRRHLHPAGRAARAASTSCVRSSRSSRSSVARRTGL